MKPESIARCSTPIRDPAKWEAGKANFAAIIDSLVAVGDMSDAAIRTAVYYANTLAVLPNGGNKAKKSLYAEAKRRGFLT